MSDKQPKDEHKVHSTAHLNGTGGYISYETAIKLHGPFIGPADVSQVDRNKGVRRGIARSNRNETQERVRCRALGIGNYLPTERRRLLTNSTPEDTVERPNVLLFGGVDLYGALKANVQGTVAVPAYIEHFNGTRGWDEEPREDEREGEREVERKEKRDEAKATARKRRVESANLQCRMDDETRSGTSCLDRLTILEMMEEHEAPSERSDLVAEFKRARKSRVAKPVERVEEEEERFWPDPVPHYLIDRRESYGINRRRVTASFSGAHHNSAHEHQKRPILREDAPVSESEEEIEIVDMPPDAPNVTA
jgi:hypothetical protein